ncbi:hypothetical protein D3C87_301280 [compost metagenome]
MKKIFVSLLGLLTATAAFATPNTQSIKLVDAESKALAKVYVENSTCIRIYEIKTKTTGVIDKRTEVVAQIMTLRSEADPGQYYRIYSDKRGGKGAGLMEVGAFALPRCGDYQEL